MPDEEDEQADGDDRSQGIAAREGHPHSVEAEFAGEDKQEWNHEYHLTCERKEY